MIRLSWRLLIVSSVACALISSPSMAGWEIGDEAELMDSSLRFHGSAGSSDGQGGMLMMAIDQGGSPSRVSVTRVDHTGTEVWGDNGFWLPIIMGDSPNFLPTAVTHDGQGGGYFAFHVTNGGDDYLKVARVDAAGTWLWTTAIDNLGTAGTASNPNVQLVTTGGGKVIIVFTRFTGGPILYSVCVDQTGTIVWHGPIHDSWGWDSYAIAKSDGLGGAFISYWRSWTPDEVRVQRLNESNGARVWGTDGALVWSGAVGGVIDIVADGAGGGYLVRDSVGITYAQHVNASGVVTWMPDLAVHDTQTAYWAQSTQARLCEDGAGGFILYHGIEDMFAQRVDVNGSLLWGGGVAVAATVDVGCPRTISPDGLGGAIVTWEDNWLIPDSSTQCDQVNGVRVNSFGEVAWTEILGWCGFNNTPTGPDVFEEPHTVRGFGDGSGGGMFAWMIDDIGNGDDIMWGMGLDAAGGEPAPRVSFLHPDNAQPGDSGPYLILGDYLDLNLGYTLEHEAGSASLGLVPTTFHSHQMLGGTAALTGLTTGAYDLETDDGGTVVDTFEDALGIGYTPACDEDYVILGEERAVNLAGSQRQSARMADGSLHVVWIEYEPTPRYYVNWFRWDGWWEEHRSPYSSDVALREPTLTADADGNLHLAFVEEIDAMHDQLRYLKIAEEEGVVINDVHDPGEVIRNPVIAWAEDGVVHVVMERGTSPGNDLWHVEHDGSDFSAGVNPTTNGSPRNPDLAAMGSALELVWASDSVFPGIQMIERAAYEGGGWHPTALVSFGLVMTSPSVAFDGNDQTLYAWIMDNELVNGIPPLVHTQLRVADTFGEVRARPGWSHHHSVSVASPGAGKFVMVTSESEGGPIVRIVAREGDGGVFFPRLQVNTGTDVQNPRFAVEPGGALINAWWHSFGSLAEPVMGVDCEIRATSAPAPDAIVIDRSLIGRPNPFNPGTAFEFELARDTYVILEVFDLRGRLVKTLHRGVLGSGPQAIKWDGTDEHGASLASGTYLARLKRDDGSTSVAKVALLK